MPNVRDDSLARETMLLGSDARGVASDTRRFFSRHRIEHAAALDERHRVEREVHDGALQALTGVSLQLAVLQRLIESDPRRACELVGKMQQIIGEEQRSLRAWLGGVHAHGGTSAKFASEELIAALRALCLRAESQWGLRVELRHGALRAVAHVLADSVYRIVQEAIANAGKHARAANAVVRVDLYASAIEVVVTDDGIGFALRGRHDLASLQRMGQGPRSLMNRVASLQGEMWLTSDGSGSRLEFLLPTGAPANRVYSSA